MNKCGNCKAQLSSSYKKCPVCDLPIEEARSLRLKQLNKLENLKKDILNKLLFKGKNDDYDQLLNIKDELLKEMSFLSKQIQGQMFSLKEDNKVLVNKFFELEEKVYEIDENLLDIVPDVEKVREKIELTINELAKEKDVFGKVDIIDFLINKQEKPDYRTAASYVRVHFDEFVATSEDYKRYVDFSRVPKQTTIIESSSISHRALFKKATNNDYMSNLLFDLKNIINYFIHYNEKTNIILNELLPSHYAKSQFILNYYYLLNKYGLIE